MATTFEQYWIGKDIDVDSLWDDFDQGIGYIHKVENAKLHLLRLTFSGHPKHLPLFDHEVIFKTVKATFHDVKQECMTARAYDEAAPIFLYRIDRGSGIYEFLAELSPLLVFLGALGTGAMWYRNAKQKDADYDEKCWKFIKSEFPNATDEDYAAYMKASTTWQRRKALQRMINQGLHRVQLSKVPIPAQGLENEGTMIIILDESAEPPKC